MAFPSIGSTISAAMRLPWSANSRLIASRSLKGIVRIKGEIAPGMPELIARGTGRYGDPRLDT